MDVLDRDKNLVGKLLTWASSLASLFIILPVGFLGLFSLAIAGPRVVPDGPGLFVCHTEACRQEGFILAGACFGVVVVAIVLMALAVRSTRRALALAALGASLIAGAILALPFVLGRDTWPPEMVLVTALVPGAFGLGSWLRRQARRPH
jgi:hypothetical protein